MKAKSTQECVGRVVRARVELFATSQAIDVNADLMGKNG
jgi:hypothetical protein